MSCPKYHQSETRRDSDYCPHYFDLNLLAYTTLKRAAYQVQRGFHSDTG